MRSRDSFIGPFTGQFYSFSVYMVCANSIVNPFVYAIQYHEFQQRVKELFSRDSDNVETSSTVRTTKSNIETNK